MIADEHPLIRRGFCDLLSLHEGLRLCGEASSTEQALAIADQCEPDVAVLELSFGGPFGGLELIRRLSGLGVRSLVSSVYDELIFAERALAAGALGYINKREPLLALVEGIDTVAKGKMYLQSAVKEQLIACIARGRDLRRSPMHQLTERELQIFELVGRGYSTREVASQLELSPKTVETHRERLKRKLDLKSGNQLVARAAAWLAESR